MGDPAKLLLGGTSALQFGGALFQAKSAIDQAKVEQDAFEASARFNTAVATREAAREEARVRRGSRRKLASQRVKFAKSGVRLEGSPLQVLTDNAAEFEVDAMNVRIDGHNQGLLERQRAGVQSAAAERRGRNLAGAALLRGGTQAGGSLLTALTRR